MPFISIIIPTHNNEEHIEQAINSCFNSNFYDFEIIVINDASTDKTTEIIKQLAKKKEKTIKIINNPEKLGAGLSRNIGIESAIGEYLLFLDGDDWFEPNAIKTAANTAKKTGAEVIIFNHQRVWADNEKTVNLPNRYTNLKLVEKNISDIKDRKGAIKNLHTVWNKAYKLYYIKEINIKFSSGIYQDIPWSIKALCLAKTAYYNPTILINYRQREGAVTKIKSKDHFNVFKQLTETLNFIKNNAFIKDNYKIEIYEYCKLLLFGIIKVKYRIHKEDEKIFLRNCYKEIFRWRKELKIESIDIPWTTLIIGKRYIFMLTQKKPIKHHSRTIQLND